MNGAAASTHRLLQGLLLGASALEVAGVSQGPLLAATLLPSETSFKRRQLG